MALEAEPTPLARRIADVLKTTENAVRPNVNGITNGISTSDAKDPLNAVGEASR